MWNRPMRTSSLRAEVADATPCMTSAATRASRTTAACRRRSPRSTSIKQVKVMILSNVQALPQIQHRRPKRAKRRLTTARPESQRGRRVLGGPGVAHQKRERTQHSEGSSERRKGCSGFLWHQKAQALGNRNARSALGRNECIFNNG